VSRIVADLKDHGTVTRAWLGVEIQGVTQDIADSLRLKSDAGALVSQPQDGSPATTAGIKSGDVITAVNGSPVKDPRDLALRISTMSPGSKVTITYWRDGASHDVDVSLAKMPNTDQQASADEPQAATPASALDDFGLSVGPSDDHSGVVITDVDPSGQAAERGLQAGDVILSVGSTSVTDPSEVAKKVADAKSGGLKAVLLRVKSGDQTRYVALSFART
jgi:serine protease Do